MYSSRSYLDPIATSSCHEGSKGMFPAIGLDFGTSTAALAAIIRDKETDPSTLSFHAIVPINAWPCDPIGTKSMSVRTSIFFPPGKLNEPVCGYEVADRIKKGDVEIIANPKLVFENIKMFLHPLSHKTAIVDRLVSNFKALQKAGYEGDEYSIIVRLLVYLLKHTKDQLRHRIDPTLKPEISVAMPNDWGINADRVMCSCLSLAVRVVWPIYGDNEEVDIFTVSEPDAQSSYTLASRGSWRNHDFPIKIGQNILVGDAGGGTLEACCYRLRNDDPCRFEELCKTSAGNCGSAFLDEDFTSLARKKIEDLVEKVFPKDLQAGPVKGTSGRLLQEFESSVKRNLDLSKLSTGQTTFKVDLQRTPKSGFETHEISISRDEWIGIFGPRMDQVVAVLDRQLVQSRSRSKPFEIHAIIMSGEYPQNAEFRRAIRYWVDKNWKTRQPEIAFTNERTAAAVVIGTVFRALDKSNGPGRYLRAGFGIVQALPAPDDDADQRIYPKNDPDLKFFSEGNGIRLKQGKDGLWYSFNTIKWILGKGSALKPGQRSGPHPSKHVFHTLDEDWVFAESLYTTVEILENNWPIDHRNNKEALWYCDLDVNVNHLKEWADLFKVGDQYELNLDLWLTVGAEFHHRLTFELSCERYNLPSWLISQKQQVMLQPFFQPSTI